MFYAPIEENQRLIAPISPTIRGEFEIVRNNFNEWLRVWKMRATKNNKDLFKFFQKTKNSFINVCTNEVETLKSVKIQFSLLVRFYMIRDEKVEEMNHYFNRMRPVILNEHNIDILNLLLNQFIDEVKGQIEAWSERGSGWIMDKILEAFINVAQYRPLRGGSYMVLPTKLKNKRAILNIQNWDNQCLRWALRAHLFPAPRGRNPIRPSSYPTEDVLNFAGIDFPTPVSQIDRLERQNENLAINVFGWEKGQVVVHRISEKGGETPRINLMLIKQGENTHYSLVKRLSALLYDQNRHNESKHFCKRCLHGYSRRELLERHKPECKGLLKSPTRTDMPKQGENKMTFKNFYKQMKAPYVVYAVFVFWKSKYMRARQQTELDNKNWEAWAMRLFLYDSEEWWAVFWPIHLQRWRRCIQVSHISLKTWNKNARRQGKQKAAGHDKWRLAKIQECHRMPHL